MVENVNGVYKQNIIKLKNMLYHGSHEDILFPSVLEDISVSFTNRDASITHWGLAIAAFVTWKVAALRACKR
jgi:hypothetical protein